MEAAVALDSSIMTPKEVLILSELSRSGLEGLRMGSEHSDSSFSEENNILRVKYPLKALLRNSPLKRESIQLEIL